MDVFNLAKRDVVTLAELRAISTTWPKKIDQYRTCVASDHNNLEIDDAQRDLANRVLGHLENVVKVAVNPLIAAFGKFPGSDRFHLNENTNNVGGRGNWC